MPKQNILPFPQSPEPAAPALKTDKLPKPMGYLLGYWIGLFSLAALLILLSWVSTQQRRNQAELDAAQNQHAAFSASAMENMLLLQQENEQLRQQVHNDSAAIDSLLKEIERLTARLEAAGQ